MMYDDDDDTKVAVGQRTGPTTSAAGSGLPSSDGEISVVKRLRLPPFWPEKPQIWFFQIEAQFRLEGIRSETVKFNTLVANLDTKYLEHIWDIIGSDVTDKYEASKKRLLNIFQESDDRQLKKLLTGLELGDMLPSQLFRKMKALAGTEITEKVLRALWLDKLPSSMKDILSVCDGNLDKLVVVADKIADNSRSEIYNVDPPGTGLQNSSS